MFDEVDGVNATTSRTGLRVVLRDDTEAGLDDVIIMGLVGKFRRSVVAETTIRSIRILR